MNVNDWFNMVGYKKTTRPHDPMCFWNEDEEYEIWFSKYDDSYITFVGLEDDMEYSADKEITEELKRRVLGYYSEFLERYRLC